MKKQIQDIQIGDKVKVYNVHRKEFGVSTVTDLYRGESDHHYLLNDSIKVTEGHPFYVRDKRKAKGFRWTKVMDLKPGDKLMKKNGKFSKIKSVVRYNEGMKIYNMTVDGEHNYFAGGFLVHNKGYLGNNTKSKAGQDATNSATADWNTEVTTTGIENFSSAIEGYDIAAKEIGAVDEAINNSDAPEIPTGFTKTLFDALESSRISKTESRQAIGDEFRSNQETIANTLTTANVIGPQEKLEMITVKDLESDLVKADTTQSNEIAQANRDFEAAKIGVMNDAKDEAKVLADEYSTTYKLGESSIKSSWADGNNDSAIPNYTQRSRNLVWNMGSSKEDWIGQRAWQSDPISGNNSKAEIFNTNPQADPGASHQKINEVNSALMSPDAPNTDISQSIQSVWSDPIIALKSNNDSIFGGSNNAHNYVQKGNCFGAETLIEVIE